MFPPLKPPKNIFSKSENDALTMLKIENVKKTNCNKLQVNLSHLETNNAEVNPVSLIKSKNHPEEMLSLNYKEKTIGCKL